MGNANSTKNDLPPLESPLHLIEDTKILSLESSSRKDLLPQLECPICMEYMHPPIKQCSTGHTMCESCSLKLTECPTCKSHIQNTRNFALEDIHSVINFPCTFENKGCSFISKWDKLQEHLVYCQYADLSCIANNCKWKGSKNNMIDHLTEKHKDKVINENNLIKWDNFNNPHSLTKNIHQSRFVIVDTKPFLHVNQFQYKNLAQWAVYLMGPPEEARKYDYEITFSHPSIPEEKLSIRQTCQSLKNKTAKRDHFNINKGIVIKSVIFFPYCNEDHSLEYLLKIFRK